ncbi:hypothetical protein HDU82_008561 [Entophlyctis luteolus]|nr:hypothetical protein HDU82_008561 [Entophlyctis luteolus]
MSGKYAALVDVDADTDAGLRPVGAAVVSSAAASVPTSSEPHSLLDSAQSQLEFQSSFLAPIELNLPSHRKLLLPDFVLNSAEQNLASSSSTAGRTSSGPNLSGSKPPAAQAPQPQNASAQSAFWTIEYYARYFDVDTTDVVQRVIAALIPKDNFLDKISSNPDLYGS